MCTIGFILSPYNTTVMRSYTNRNKILLANKQLCVEAYVYMYLAIFSVHVCVFCTYKPVAMEQLFNALLSS